MVCQIVCLLPRRYDLRMSALNVYFRTRDIGVNCKSPPSIPLRKHVLGIPALATLHSGLNKFQALSLQTCAENMSVRVPLERQRSNCQPAQEPSAHSPKQMRIAFRHRYNNQLPSSRFPLCTVSIANKNMIRANLLFNFTAPFYLFPFSFRLIRIHTPSTAI